MGLNVANQFLYFSYLEPGTLQLILRFTYPTVSDVTWSRFVVNIPQRSGVQCGDANLQSRAA